MPIQSLTNVSKSFMRLGRIKKGMKDSSAPGGMVDLDYFRVVFEKSAEKFLEPEFRKVYGEKPTRINIRLAFTELADNWDANYECYKKGGLIAKAGENENGAYWIYYRDPATSEVLVRDGRPVGWSGEQFIKTPIDLTKAVYSYKNNKQESVDVFLEPVGRLSVVIPELAKVLDDKGRPIVGFFEFCPVSPRDIRTVSSELLGIEFMAKNAGSSITGVPMALIRREEQVTKNIKGVLSKGPSWVVHIELGGTWGGKALEFIELKALPGPHDHEDEDILDGDVDDFGGEPAPKELPAPKPAAPSQPAPAPKAPAPEQSKASTRPYAPEDLKIAFERLVLAIIDAYEKSGKPLTLNPPNVTNVLAKTMDGIFDGESEKGQARHFVCEYLTGFQSTKDMSAAQVRALFKMMSIEFNDSHSPQFDDAPSNVSMEEFRAVWANQGDIDEFGADLDEKDIPF